MLMSLRRECPRMVCHRWRRHLLATCRSYGSTDRFVVTFLGSSSSERETDIKKTEIIIVFLCRNLKKDHIVTTVSTVHNRNGASGHCNLFLCLHQRVFCALSFPSPPFAFPFNSLV